VVKLSIVDQSLVASGSTPAQALQNSIELAQLADRLGYERFWIAEHHATGSLASPAPEILMARIGAETKHIRIGSGAVLLPHYASLKVAEVFRMLHALYPDRIDLGIGRAPGGTPLETYALSRDRSKNAVHDDFPEQLIELLAFLNHGFPEDHPFRHILVTPEMPGGPEVWLLGSSMWSASAAAQLGLPYAFAHFISPQSTRDAISYYKANLEPVDSPLAGQTILALGAIVADTEAEAEHMYASRRLRFIRQGQGRDGPIPTPEEALAELKRYTGPVRQEEGEWPRYAVGTPEQVREKLRQVVDELGVDELMVITVVHSHEGRMRSYELLAQAFDLTPRAIEPAARA
jgi:luciferase family oxidoreductase group 1